jgi:hypothetical protein
VAKILLSRIDDLRLELEAAPGTDALFPVAMRVVEAAAAAVDEPALAARLFAVHAMLLAIANKYDSTAMDEDEWSNIKRVLSALTQLLEETADADVWKVLGGRLRFVLERPRRQ